MISEDLCWDFYGAVYENFFSEFCEDCCVNCYEEFSSYVSSPEIDFFSKICLSTISCCGQSSDYELSKIFGSMTTQSDDKNSVWSFIDTSVENLLAVSIETFLGNSG